jgi:hypothetical protein
MRRRFVLRPDGAGDWRLVEIDLEAPRRPAMAPVVLSDFTPYRSMRTGETIDGRAAHRAHLQRYGLVEVGNELAPFVERPAVPLDPIGPDIKRELARDPAERRGHARAILQDSGYNGPAIERILKGSGDG